MIRYGLGILVAAGAFVLSGCGDEISNTPPNNSGGQGGSSGGGGGNPMGGGGSSGGTGGPVANQCTGECCPTDNSCYSSSAGKSAPGAECLAALDNTAALDPASSNRRIQMRQTWLRPATPKGNTIPIVYGTLNAYTTLKDPTCNTPSGASGYMQAIDFDLAKGESRVGYATYVPDTAAAKANGVCLAETASGDAGWTDKATVMGTSTDFSLPASQMSPSADYPPGLPAPMPQPWKFGPTKAKRVDTDFDVSTDAGRKEVLAHFTPTGDFTTAGYNGIFYFNETTGISHGFSPLAWQIIYDPPPMGAGAPTTFILVPIREAETKSQFNDPKHPNCVGYLNTKNLDPTTNCANDYSDPINKAPWSGWPGVDDTPGEGSASVHGYFLITELEQIYSIVLQSTLCVSYPTFDQSKTDGWATDADKRCRATTNAKKWNPTDMTAGLPNGDWCAHTNQAATADCHDAYRSVSYHAFQGFKIKDGTCPPF